jgi:hypothetical protein
MWATYASMNMDENAAKWVQMYKKRYGLGDWTSFITAVEKKFGDNDYRAALTQLLDLHQEDSLENYITTFEDLQYHIVMHNAELGELFFITQFMKGLKLEISVVVQSQVPETMKRAILLARIQQQVLDKGKTKWQRTFTSNKQPLHLQKGEAKPGNQTSTLWREGNLGIREEQMACVVSVLSHMMQIIKMCVQRSPTNKLR